MKRERIKVLMYHRVVREKPRKEPRWMYVTLAEFRRQMKILERLNFTPITFSDYRLWLEKRLTLPRKPIILTFDDGYLDTWELAIPVLKEFGMRAVIFVLGDRHLRSARWDEREGEEPLPLMNDDQIRAASSWGFEIGSHGMSHRPLARLDDREIRYEIHDSKRILESLLGEEVCTISYPYGNTDQRVIAETERAGYSFGCGVFSGPPRFGDHSLDFRRIAVNPGKGAFRFLIQVTTPYEYAEWAWSRMNNRKMETRRAFVALQTEKP